ncbi:MAG: helix-turn-helix domain-containing protein [Methyloligellaceae bacterium]
MNRISLGNRLKKRRKELGFTQKEVAEKSGISVSYLNLIENNRRDISGKILKNIASSLELNVSQLTGVADERLLQELLDIANDPLMGRLDLETSAPQEIVGSFPGWGKGIAHIYNSYREVRDKLNDLSDILPGDMLPEESTHRMLSLITSIRSFSEILAEEEIGEMDRERFSRKIAGESRQLGEITKSLMDLLDVSGTETPQPFPMGEVEDFLIDKQNYFPELEEGADILRKKLSKGGMPLENTIVDYLNETMGISLSYSKNLSLREAGNAGRYQYNSNTKHLVLNEKLPKRTILFQLTKFIVEFSLKEGLNQIAGNPRFTSTESRRLAFQAMARYAAGALLFPYDEFLEEAQNCRYDIQLLGQHFSGSYEQVCHRLVTLRKPGAEGIPFAFLRTDVAGNLSKRFNLPNLRFPRYGSACPLWISYRTFMTPNSVRTQLARMPDQQMFLFISRTVSKSTDTYGTPEQIYSVLLACDVAHLDDIIYGDGYDTAKETLITDAGINCKLCPRTNCSHRAHALIHPLTRNQEQD